MAFFFHPAFIFEWIHLLTVALESKQLASHLVDFYFRNLTNTFWICHENKWKVGEFLEIGSESNAVIIDSVGWWTVVMVSRIPPLINVAGLLRLIKRSIRRWGKWEVPTDSTEHWQRTKAAGWCNGLQGIYEATVWPSARHWYPFTRPHAARPHAPPTSTHTTAQNSHYLWLVVLVYLLSSVRIEKKKIWDPTLTLIAWSWWSLLVLQQEDKAKVSW